MFKQRMNADEAKELFLNAFYPLSDTGSLPIEYCDGRIIAHDIIAGINVPHYRRAAMDGFAVRASETLGASSNSPVILKLAQFIENGTCVKVHTGSPIPQGADAVVMLEDTQMQGDKIEIFTQLHPGEERRGHRGGYPER